MASDTYGTCPICGAPGVHRERRVNGDDWCAGGHVYPSADAITGEKTPDRAVEYLTAGMAIYGTANEVIGRVARDLKAGERIAIVVYPDRLESCAIDFRPPDTETPSNVTADGVRVYPGDVVWEPWPRDSRAYEVRTFDGLYFDAVRDDAVNGVMCVHIADCYSTLAAADAAEADRPRAAAVRQRTTKGEAPQ